MAAETWFVHSVSGIDTERESDASYARDNEAWAFLISRLADVLIAPNETLMEDSIHAAPELGFFDSKNEAMVYRLRGNPPKPQVLIMGEVRDAIDRGRLVSEAQRRNTL
jgi:hypothetical protein